MLLLKAFSKSKAILKERASVKRRGPIHGYCDISTTVRLWIHPRCPSVDEWRMKVYINNGVLFSHKIKWNYVIFRKMYRTRHRCAEQTRKYLNDKYHVFSYAESRLYILVLSKAGCHLHSSGWLDLNMQFRLAFPLQDFSCPFLQCLGITSVCLHIWSYNLDFFLSKWTDKTMKIDEGLFQKKRIRAREGAKKGNNNKCYQDA